MFTTSVSTDPAHTPQPLDDPSLGSLHEVARANLYYLLARSLSSPLEMEAAHTDLLRKVVADLDSEVQTAGLALAKEWEEALEDRETLSLAYARLFLGPFEILAPPYASFYLEHDQRLMGEVSQNVAHTYAAAGLGPGNCPREAPDHAALEWEFMYFLTYQFITTGEEQWLKQRKQFCESHLSLWMPSLAKAMVKAKQHVFYDAVVRLFTVVLEEVERD